MHRPNPSLAVALVTDLQRQPLSQSRFFSRANLPFAVRTPYHRRLRVVVSVVDRLDLLDAVVDRSLEKSGSCRFPVSSLDPSRPLITLLGSRT